MAFREIAVTVRAVNRASHEFARIRSDAESLASSVRAVGAAISGLGATGSAIAHIAHQFGLLNTEQMRVVTGATYLVTVMGMFMRTSWGVAAAQKVYAAACSIATAVQNAFNVSFATALALTGIGIAALIAAAGAIAYFAAQMTRATESVQAFNAAASEVPARARSISRAGELELARRGVE